MSLEVKCFMFFKKFFTAFISIMGLSVYLARIFTVIFPIMSQCSIGALTFFASISWVACIYVPPVTQPCRRTKGPNRHGWLVVYVEFFDEHSDRGYFFIPVSSNIFFRFFYVLDQDRASCTSRFWYIKLKYLQYLNICKSRISIWIDKL